MTTVTNRGADAFISRLPRETVFFLVHGADEGLVRERARGIVNARLGGSLDPLRLVRLEGDAVAREPGLLADEAYAVSMFPGHRVIWIDLQARDIAPTLAMLFARPPEDCTIVIEAGSLKKGSALRSACEKMQNGASVECYADDRQSLAAIIEAQAREAGLRIAPDVRDYLGALLGADRMTTRGELAKLFLYARGAGEVTAADVEAIVSDAAPSTLDDAVDSAFLGEHAAIEGSLGGFLAGGGDPSFLLRATIQRAMLLHRLRIEIDHGRSPDTAMQALHVRLSPARRGALERQLGRWSTSRLARLLEPLRTAAGRARRDARMADMIATRALWALASSARAAAP